MLEYKIEAYLPTGGLPPSFPFFTFRSLSFLSKMLGIVELHGAKQVLRNPETNTILPFPSPYFLPGDQVFQSLDTECVLRHRTPQTLCAVVRSVDPLHVTYVNLPPMSLFQPKLELLFTPTVGERIVFLFTADGGYELLRRYSADPKEDVPCLLALYKGGCEAKEADLVRRDPLYTRADNVDHEDLDTFTIDPASSVDFDDAISVDPETHTIYVHIVDIAHAELSAEEQRRLQARCLTLYLANEHTEHLLDEETASHRLSLVQGVRRPVITVKLTMNEGLVERYEIYRSTIVVKHRYNYEEVQAALEAGTANSAIQYLDRLTKERSREVQYAVNLPSLRLTIDKPSGLATALRSESTNDPAHSLVATAMILANMTVSHHLTLKGVTIPNRFHSTLRGFKPTTIATGNSEVDSFILVKRFARAYYSVDEKGHFGLDLKEYVHFTSPMRRYADVIVHNLLAGLQYTDLEEQVTHLNHRATVVRSLQDLYERWKTMRWIQALPADTKHNAYVTDTKKAGIMWFIPSLLLNGFSHVATLQPPQFWGYREAMNYLVGAARTIGLGDIVDAKLSDINPLTGTYTCTIIT